jgi:hypothetical protein
MRTKPSAITAIASGKCEAIGEYAMAEQIRQILMQEQDHQIDLATALGIEVPDVSGGPQARTLRKRR